MKSSSRGRLVLKALNDKWELVSLSGVSVNIEKLPYLEFTDELRVHGFTGCNRISGSYTLLSEEHIRFEQLISTRMACPDLKIESEIISILKETEKFKIDGDQLILYLKEDQPSMIFRKQKLC